jgi:tripartite-type tricarboxylate transporter receptor subunit TctC
MGQLISVLRDPNTEASANRLSAQQVLTRLLARSILCGALIGPLHAAEWPSRTVRIIAPSTPGGAADTFARILAERLTAKFGVAFVVENRTGGGGLVGVASTAKSDPDGYSLVISSAAYNTIEPFVSKNPGFDPARDFTHIAYIGGQANTFLVGTRARSGADWRSLGDVIAAARGGAAIDYVSPGLGTLGHLLVESVARAAGVRLQHIPHRGSSQAMIDLVAGTVPFGTMTWGSAIGQIRAGTVRPVAVSSAQRVAEYPDVPTLREQGYDIVADSWFGLSGPAGLAPEIVAQLNAAVIEILALPDVKARLASDAIVTPPLTPEQFSALVAGDIAKWQPAVARLGLGH